MSPPYAQFGDTTYTKVFVGGLAWETKKGTMKKYFEQFGEILEAVVITDKNTGRSKGYGFVTFREPEAASRSCIDPLPVIDGRRANCNLASLGAHRTKSTTPQHGGSRSFRVMKAFHSGHQGGMGTTFSSPATFPRYALQHGIPYNVYRYPPYSPEYTYPTNYYNMYGNSASAPYLAYGGAAGMVAGTTAFYPYFEFGQATSAGPYANGPGYGMQYPPVLQYSGVASTAGVTGFSAQHYGGPSPVLNATSQPGMTMAFTAPAVPSPTAHSYRLISSHFSVSTAT